MSPYFFFLLLMPVIHGLNIPNQQSSNEVHSLSSAVSDLDECPICLEPFMESKTLEDQKVPFHLAEASSPKSKHFFHYKCLSSSMVFGNSTLCPFCRCAPVERAAINSDMLAFYCSLSFEHPIICCELPQILKNCTAQVIKRNLSKCLEFGYFDKALKILQAGKFLPTISFDEIIDFELFKSLPLNQSFTDELKSKVFAFLFIEKIKNVSEGDLLSEMDLLFIHFFGLYQSVTLDSNKESLCWKDIFEVKSKSDLLKELYQGARHKVHLNIFSDEKLFEQSEFGSIFNLKVKNNIIRDMKMLCKNIPALQNVSCTESTVLAIASSVFNSSKGILRLDFVDFNK